MEKQGDTHIYTHIHIYMHIYTHIYTHRCCATWSFGLLPKAKQTRTADRLQITLNGKIVYRKRNVVGKKIIYILVQP